MRSGKDGGLYQGKRENGKREWGFGELRVWCAALAGVALLPFGDMGSVRFGFPRCQHVVSVLCLLILAVLSCRRMVGDQTRGEADGETMGSRRTWPELGGRGGVERWIRSCADRMKRGGGMFLRCWCFGVWVFMLFVVRRFALIMARD